MLLFPQIIDDNNQQVPPRKTGTVAIRVRPYRTVGMFSGYVVSQNWFAKLEFWFKAETTLIHWRDHGKYPTMAIIGEMRAVDVRYWNCEITFF